MPLWLLFLRNAILAVGKVQRLGCCSVLLAEKCSQPLQREGQKVSENLGFTLYGWV